MNTSSQNGGTSSVKRSLGRKYGERDSHPIYVWNGILEPKHLKKLGPAFSLFVWLIDRTTKEHDGVGAVLGGKPLTAEEIRSSMGVHEQTIRRRLDRLEHYSYIDRTLTGQGYIIRVMKSCKFPKRAPAEVVQECTTSKDTGSAELPDQVVQECPTRSCKTARPNKSKQLSKQGGSKKTAAQTAAPDPTPATGFELTAPEPEPAGDHRHSQFVKFAVAAFKGKYGTEPSWPKKDYAMLADKLANNPHLTVDDLKGRWLNFLASTHHWHEEKGGSLAHFCLNADVFIAGPLADHQQKTFHQIARDETDNATRNILGMLSAGMDSEAIKRNILAQRAAGVDTKALPATSGNVIVMEKEPLPAQPALPARAGQETTNKLTERQALGIILRDPAALEKHQLIRNRVAEDFKDVRHQTIFTGLRRMWNAGEAIAGQPIPAASLIEHLEVYSGELKRAGGEGYIRSLVDAPARKEAMA